ncbi:uncharacterized protein LOC127838930 isoform X2 [Dreissena polymorpha]|uniref:uncharacterized protein LOC127838930 isoform X2 n=1 Tax=Dreissena polymorpha TaxID=45954 RepID=UPI002263E0EE|nr:uncharacterized protein LOC127838930 isoform X2 [Dreissena polymorpha]
MGNHHARPSHQRSDQIPEHPIRRSSSKSSFASSYLPALEKLFQKLELTAEEDNGHPGEITRATFEGVFKGPLQLFGKLLYEQMVTNNHHSDKVKERISSEQFVKSSKALLSLFDATDQHKYYFKLFAQGKEYLTRDDALNMVNIAYALTLASSMIAFRKQAKDDKVFESVVNSMFGMKPDIKFPEMQKWLDNNCPNMFSGVHNWVYTILTGSKMPEEMEVAPVPMLEQLSEGNHVMCMGMLYMLTASLPNKYTHVEKETESTSQQGTKNPLLTSFQILRKLARLSRCQSWKKLYDSDEHGLSMNRFSHHVLGYKDSSLTLISFEGRNIYCIASDDPWRESVQKFGREDACVIQISPVFKIVQSGGPLLMWNLSDRAAPKGIYIGQTGKANIITVPTEFNAVLHYGVKCELHQIEMWGCGGGEAFQAQQKQKQWERKEVEKHASRKLHLDTNWDENPDKQLLSWGGVEVNHQYSQGGAM